MTRRARGFENDQSRAGPLTREVAGDFAPSVSCRMNRIEKPVALIRSIDFFRVPILVLLFFPLFSMVALGNFESLLGDLIKDPSAGPN